MGLCLNSCDIFIEGSEINYLQDYNLGTGKF